MIGLPAAPLLILCVIVERRSFFGLPVSTNVFQIGIWNHTRAWRLRGGD